MDGLRLPSNIRPPGAFYRNMRATTIRFPNDLWDQLEREAKQQGISVAQYVRDAALYRVAFSAGAAAEEEAKRDPSLRTAQGTRFRR